MAFSTEHTCFTWNAPIPLPIETAWRDQDAETLHSLLSVMPDNVCKRRLTSTLLSLAMDEPVTDKHIIGILLENGADVKNSLKRAHPDVLKIIIDHGINLRDSLLVEVVYSFTHLFDLHFSERPFITIMPEYEQKIACVRLLLEAGYDVNSNISGETILCFFINRGLLTRETLAMLLHHGVDVNPPPYSFHTPLMIAVAPYRYNEEFFNTTDILGALLEAGADINAQDAEGDTALHRAVCKGRMDTVIWLIQNGADVYAANDELLTVLDTIPHGSLLSVLSTVLGQGVYPCKVKPGRVVLSSFEHFLSSCGNVPPATPMSLAVCQQNRETALLFRNIGFLTGEDLQWLPGNGQVRDKLPPGCQQTYDSVVLNGPCPLTLISFVKISDMLGASRYREEAVKQLGLPVSLQERLLFKRPRATFFSSP